MSVARKDLGNNVKYFYRVTDNHTPWQSNLILKLSLQLSAGVQQLEFFINIYINHPKFKIQVDK